MRRLIQMFPLLLVIGMTSSTAIAQPPSTPVPLHHFKTDFVVKEVDAGGHVINSRSFSTILATTNENSPNQIRSGDRVPLRTNSGEKERGIVYIDTGVNVDCRLVHEIDQKLAMSIKAEISSVAPGTEQSSPLDPVIRQFQWNADVLISPGVPTTIFSSDDVNSKTKVQVEVTATLIK